MRTLIVCVSLVLALSQAAPAAEADDLYSGNNIMPGCRAFPDPTLMSQAPMLGFKAGLCVGYIRGLDFAGGILRAGSGPVPFCVPEKAAVGQMVRVVVNYADRHPEQMHEPFAVLVALALAGAWPCQP
jgi:hypothetical protein